MNKIKILISALLMGFVFTSCDTNDEPTGYDPANYNYTLPSAFKLNVESVSDRSFEFSYTPTIVGKGYYMVLPAGAKAPTSTEVHAGGGLQSGKFDVDGETPIVVKVDKTIYGGYAYDVYAINKSTDNFISETVAKITATTVEGNTPDAEPKIVSITPSFQSADHEFMNQSVTFTFSEPVKLVDNASFNFRMFLNGGIGVVRDFDIVSPTHTLGGTVIEGYATEITISGWNSIPNAFTIVNFDEGTFVDKAGKLVPGISRFNYYFRAKAGTPSEIATLLVGDWDYTVAENTRLPDTVLSGTRGTWSITKGTKDGTIILSNQIDHDINAFLGWDDSATREFEVTVGVPDERGRGRLYMAPHKSGVEKSIFSDGTDLYWTSYYEDLINPLDPDLTGEYDLANKTIHFRLDLGSRLGYAFLNPYYLGDVQYDYTYVSGTGDLGKPERAVKTSKGFVGENLMLPVKSTSTNEYLMSLPAKAKTTVKAKGKVKYVDVLK